MLKSKEQNDELMSSYIGVVVYEALETRGIKKIVTATPLKPAFGLSGPPITN